MKIIRYAVSHPVTVWMVTLAAVVFGLTALGRLDMRLLPEIRYPTLTVQTEYADAVSAKFVQFMDGDGSRFRWAPYEMVVDSPDKGIKKKAKDADQILTPLVESLQSAESEAIIISPYFVPRKRGVEGFSALEERGVDVTIVTNSLAANNQFTVHAGYAGSRKPLLKAGAEIWEIKPHANFQGTELVAAVGAKATLHTKAFIVDREKMFIGSFNFDPRSANINTELGVIIHDPGLASHYADHAAKVLPTSSYEVFLDDRNKLRWRDYENFLVSENRWRASLLRIPEAFQKSMLLSEDAA